MGRLIEAVAQVAPYKPVRSLRQGTRAQALRDARTCYDHLAGRLGVAIMRAMIERGQVIGGDGIFDPDRARLDSRSGYGHDVDYRLTAAGRAFLTEFGVELEARRQPVVRYCVDWSEQRHHLSDRVGRGLLNRLLELDWLRTAPSSRAVQVTGAGVVGLADVLGVERSADHMASSGW